MSYILLSIGPVQSAISQARRTQDLFMGSRILSFLGRAVIEAVPASAEVIYPVVVERDASSVPNRILVRCDAGQADDLAQRLCEQVYTHWYKIASATRHKFESDFGVPSDNTIWKRQVKNWLEVYAVVVPDTGSYRRDNAEANRRLAARKLTRDFAAADEPGHKCSVTGEHEALHDQPSGQADYDAVRRYWDHVRKQQRNLAILGKGERLCALSLIKRFAHEAERGLAPEGRFPSTSSIASAPFRVALVQHWEMCKVAVADYLSALETLFSTLGGSWYDLYFHTENQFNPENFPYLEHLAEDIDPTADNNLLAALRSVDGDFLYEEGLQPAAVQEYARSPDLPSSSQLQPAQQALKDLHKLMRDQHHIQPPSSYLAVLSMDGDKMGDHASTFESSTDHFAFSRQLAEFARDQVRPIIEERLPGRLVYAGGDDVLALLPAEHALTAAEALRSAFAETFQKDNLHVSTGIAYIHRTYPLQAAVLAAKAAQERAKEDYGRNALAVALLQRSGEPLYMGFKWEVPNPDQSDQPFKIAARVQETSKAMASNNLARSLPYDIERMAYSLAGENISARARQSEFRRIFERRCKQGFDGSALCHALTMMAEHGLQDKDKNADPVQGWEDMARWLRLARFLAGEESERVAVP